MESGPTIIIADDHPLMRGALRQTIQQVLGQTARLTETDCLDQLMAALERDRNNVDLVLLDLNMPGMSGFVGLLTLRAGFPAIPVAIVSATEEVTAIRRAIDCGAAGYIPKSAAPAEFAEAIRAVLNGDIWLPPSVRDLDHTQDADADLAQRMVGLTPQQLRVLVMLTDGKLNKQIAYELNVSEATIKAHVSAILRKLGVSSRTQAVIAAGKLAAQMSEGPLANGLGAGQAGA